MPLKENKKYKILTPSGFEKFDSIRKTENNKLIQFITENNEVSVTPDHPFVIKGKEVKAKKIKIGDFLETNNGLESVKHIEKQENSKSVYDLMNVKNGNIYYTDNVLSHNSFISSSYTLIDGEIIEKMKKALIANPAEKKIITIGAFEITQFKAPVKGRAYILGADVADGSGLDYSVIHVLDITHCNMIEQVAVFASNTIATADFGLLLARVGLTYNNAYIAIEGNGIGRAILDSLIHVLEYDNIVHYGKRETGIWSHTSSKLNACIQTKTIFDSEDSICKVNDAKTLQEFSYFQRKANSARPVYQAIATKHDDYTMAIIWGLFCLQESILDNYYEIDGWFKTSNNLVLPRTVKNLENAFYDDAYKKKIFDGVTLQEIKEVADTEKVDDSWIDITKIIEEDEKWTTIE